MLRKTLSHLLLLLSVLTLTICGRPVRPEQEATVYWNLQNTLVLKVPVKGAGRKPLDVVLMYGDRQIPLSASLRHYNSSNAILQIAYPELQSLPTSDLFHLSIRQKTTHREIYRVAVIPDYNPPELSIVAHSPEIRQGGSALVIFECQDENLRQVYIRDNRGQVFKPVEFMERGYYISLFTWYIPWTRHEAWIIAEDLAGNVSSNQIDISALRVKIPVSILQVNPDFVAKKAKELDVPQAKDNQDGYKLVQKKMGETVQVNVSYLSSYVPPESVKNLDLQAFKPYQKHRVSSEWGKLRRYQYQGRITKESYHLGLDMVDVKNTPIFTSNPAKVIFSGYNGGYGNTLLLHHALGVYSLYGHCEQLLVQENQQLSPGTQIATSGQTGYATGDHLHFSILVQGVYADPLEWMDAAWLDKNILSVVKTARRIIALRNYQTVLDQKKLSVFPD